MHDNHKILIYLNLGLNIKGHVGCSCMEHVTTSGYGNCHKPYKDGPICYVKEPTTCGDVVKSDSEGPTGPTGYSWEACRTGN